MEFKSRTVAVIIQFPYDKILLVKRVKAPFKGYWALVGGKVEIGETVEQAAIRETKEETGLSIDLVEKIGEYHEKGIKDGIKYDYHPSCYLAKPVGGNIKKQGSEVEDAKLFRLRELPKELAFEHSHMIRDYILMRCKNNRFGRV